MNQIILPPKGSKYKNIKVFLDGQWFDSKGESERYVVLKIKQSNGKIEGLRCQVPFELPVPGEKTTTYFADFVYKEDGVLIVEDYKGIILTEVFKRKRKLMMKIYGIKIRITRKPR